MPRASAARSLLKLAATAAADAATVETQAFAKSGARTFGSLSTRATGSNALVSSGKRLFDMRVVGNAALNATKCPCGRVACFGRHYAAASSGAQAEAAVADEVDAHAPSLSARHKTLLQHFPSSMGVDDFIARLEMALAAYGFTGDNSIAMSNLCRDESCMILEDKIESVFGSCFSTHGLGGVLTCGVIGMKAGLSHSPVENGKERYVFFSFPHIAIDSDGKVGAISRPNRAGESAACGALIKALSDLKAEGLEAAAQPPGAHDPLEPEYSILKARIARRIKFEKGDPSSFSLVDITKVAERVISTDLEYLISKAVDTKLADYAVVTGVQIHNWAYDLEDERVPSMEFVAPARSYVVLNGEKIDLDLQQVPALSPRQLSLLASESISGKAGGTEAMTCFKTGSMLQEIPREYMLKRLGGSQSTATMDIEHTGPSWREYIKTTFHDSHHNAPKMDEHFFEDKH